MNKNSKVKKIIKNEFNFLCDKFGARLVKEEIDPYGVFVTYTTEKAGLRISIEPLEGHIYVMIFPLITGEIPSYKYWYDFLDFLHAKDVTFNIPKIKNINNPDIGEIEQAFKAYAMYVKGYASDFFRGNFEIIEDLELIVKRRKEEFKS